MVLRFLSVLIVSFFLFLSNAGCGSSTSGASSDEEEEGEEEENNESDDDLAFPGLPETKTVYTEALILDSVQGTADHYDFIDNPDDYRLLTEEIHGTEVNVAVNNTVDVDDDEAQAWSENIRDCWHSAWHVFGGYRYDKFAFLVRSTESDETQFSLSEAGVSINANTFETDGYEFACHELIHIWLGKLIAHEPDGSDNLFQAETWVSEGAVVYYSFRILADVIGQSEYTSGMDERFDDYDEARGGEFDLSISELAEEIGGDTSHEAVGVLYARGALISYLCDAEMVSAGFSMDDLLASLYENFGLTDTKWTQADLELAMQEITGESFANFFDTNLDTNAFLDLAGSFETPLEH